MKIPIFPTINASLNLLAGIFLMLGWIAIKQKRRDDHKRFMIMALAASTLFLISYVSYHYFVHGMTRYQGQGLLRTIYFTILLTHTPLAVIIVPFCIIAVRYAIKGNFAAHTKITQWLWPTWMYVSITGVLIYLMLYILPQY